MLFICINLMGEDCSTLIQRVNTCFEITPEDPDQIDDLDGMNGSNLNTDDRRTNGNTQQSTMPKVSHEFRSFPAGIETCKITANNTPRTHKILPKIQGKSANSHQIDNSRATKEVSGVPQAHMGPPCQSWGESRACP